MIEVNRYRWFYLRLRNEAKGNNRVVKLFIVRRYFLCYIFLSIVLYYKNLIIKHAFNLSLFYAN